MRDIHQAASSSVKVFTIGPLGQAIAKYLHRLHGSVVEKNLTATSISDQDCDGHDVYVIASWRPVPDLCEYLDQISRKLNRSLIPLIMYDGILQLGPVVVNGIGSCWQCWMKRTAQHAAWPDQYQVAMKHYSAHPEAGPKGYLEPVALLGAVRAKQIIHALHTANVEPGYIWQIDVMTRNMLTGNVAGVHGCSLCGLQRPARTRTVAGMESKLTALWKPSSSSGDSGSK